MEKHFFSQKPMHSHEFNMCYISATLSLLTCTLSSSWSSRSSIIGHITGTNMGHIWIWIQNQFDMESRMIQGPYKGSKFDVIHLGGRTYGGTEKAILRFRSESRIKGSNFVEHNRDPDLRQNADTTVNVAVTRPWNNLTNLPFPVIFQFFVAVGFCGPMISRLAGVEEKIKTRKGL